MVDRVGTVITKILFNVEPTTRLIYSTYSLVDAIAKNWDTIKQIIEDVKNGKFTSAMTSAGILTVSLALNKLSAFKTDILNIVGLDIPANIQAETSNVLTIVSGLTDSEISYAEKYIQEHNLGGDAKCLM